MRGRFWSNILAVAYKEATLLRHDRALLSAVLAQPIMLFLLNGFALSNKPANVPWAVLDQSQSAVSRRLVEEIQSTGYFLPPQRVSSYDQGHARLKSADALAVLVIPADLRREIGRGQPQVQLLLDGSDPMTAARVAGYIGQVVTAFAPEAEPPPLAERVDRASSRGAVDLRQRFWFNPTLRDREFFLTALAGMLLTNICLSAMGLAVVEERELGTYEQMLAQPTTAIEIILGKLIPYVALSYVVFFMATLATGVVFDLWPRGSWFTLCLVTLPFVLSSLGIGVFVSAIARTSAQAVFISVFFILPSFVLSGVMFPYQFMPPGVREVGYLFPLRWYQIAARRVIERGAGLEDIAIPTAALVGLFVVVLLAIRWRMKPRLG